MTQIKFTKEENGFIDRCFEDTLFHFIQNPRKRDDIEHIREVVNFRNYKIGYIGKENHKLMWSIFDKMGYLKDGKTTKTEEYKRQLQLEKDKADVWANNKAILLSQIKNSIEDLKQMQKDIENHETNYELMVKAEADKVRIKFQKDMKIKKEVMQKDIIENVSQRKSLNDMTVKELRDVARQNGVVGYGQAKNKAELKAMVEANI
jgi:hypothetical protein